MNTFLLGFPVGLLLGYVLQRGRFCMYTAFRDLLIARDSTLFRAYILALLVQMLLIHLLAEVGLLVVEAAPFAWLASVLGGFVFGAGIVLAGGCSTGSWYRIGEGMVGSFLAVLGYAVGVAATFWGILLPWAVYLRGFTLEGPNASLFGLLQIPKWALLAAVFVGGGFWLLRSPGPKLFTGWPWPKTGLAIGLVASVAWLASQPTGRLYGLGVTQPTGSLLRFVTTTDASVLNWGTYMVLAIPIGAFLAAAVSKEFKWRSPGPKRLLQQLLGGLLMGFGAATAGGCNIGHSLTGMATLALSSLTVTLFIILGCWTTTYLLFMRR